MTASSTPRRAGDDRPHRRPAPTGWLAAARAALLALSTLAIVVPAGFASASVPPPTPPPLSIGPGPAVPPKPPSLPGSGGRKKRVKPPRSAQDHLPVEEHTPTLSLEASCAPFRHTQTYAGWGPAVAYGRPVTVVYEADRCSTPNGRALDVSANGTARIHDGPSETGALLDTRPFAVTGTWQQPRNAAAWPPAWWDCGVEYATYTWEIPGIYTFAVTAHDGLWTLDVTSQGAGSHDLHWSHDGCA